MFKKMWFSFSQSLALVILILLLVSLMLPQIIQAKILWYMVCILAPINVFTFFTFELRLFSKHLWVRRAIVITFSVINLSIVEILFGWLKWGDTEKWIRHGVLLAVLICLNVFAYYVGDKIEKRNLAAINQKLASGNMDANKQ
jgi:hypothetical protein